MISDEDIDGGPLSEADATEDFLALDTDEGIIDAAPALRFVEPLRPQPVHARVAENDRAIGGMRRPRRAVDKLKLRTLGTQSS